MPTPTLYLASKSPRRRELLTQIGVRYEVLAVDVAEEHQPGESADGYVARLATEKAQAGAALAAGVPVLGADTIVVCDDRILEKPANQADGMSMLMSLAGRDHWVMTAVCMADAQRHQTLCNRTRVRFRAITEQEAEAYWLTGEPVDKAGGYGIQGLGGVFVEAIEGSYTSVVGLPVFETQQLLREFGVPVWQPK